jgi:hypothetical protein
MATNPPASTEAQETASEDKFTSNGAPSFQRASFLFAASLGSFIGVSLLLASI